MGRKMEELMSECGGTKVRVMRARERGWVGGVWGTEEGGDEESASEHLAGWPCLGGDRGD